MERRTKRSAAAAIGLLGLLLISDLAAAQTVPPEAPKTPPEKPRTEPRSANDPELELPPAAEGVTDLRLGKIFKRPFGDFGLEYTEKARSLEGKRIRVPGYMVNRCCPTPGQFAIAALPITLHDHEMGPCDDLPAETMYVTVPAPTPLQAVHHIVRHVPGILLLTGKLRLGARKEPDGRYSWIRLELDPPPPDADAPRTEDGAPDRDGARTVQLGAAPAGGSPPEEGSPHEGGAKPAPGASGGAAPANPKSDEPATTQTPNGGVR